MQVWSLFISPLQIIHIPKEFFFAHWKKKLFFCFFLRLQPFNLFFFFLLYCVKCFLLILNCVCLDSCVCADNIIDDKIKKKQKSGSHFVILVNSKKKVLTLNGNVVKFIQRVKVTGEK